MRASAPAHASPHIVNNTRAPWQEQRKEQEYDENVHC